MRTELKAFGFATCISFGLMLVFMGNILIVEGFGDVLIWKQILAGFILLFLGLFSVILTINFTHNTGKMTK